MFRQGDGIVRESPRRKEPKSNPGADTCRGSILMMSSRISLIVFYEVHLLVDIAFFFPMPAHVLCGLRAWQECNRLLRLGRP